MIFCKCVFISVFWQILICWSFFSEFYFCQNNAGDLRTASAEGKARTRAVGEQRRQLGDTNNVNVLDRLNILSDEEFDGLEIIEMAQNMLF